MSGSIIAVFFQVRLKDSNTTKDGHSLALVTGSTKIVLAQMYLTYSSFSTKMAKLEETITSKLIIWLKKYFRYKFAIIWSILPGILVAMVTTCNWTPLAMAKLAIFWPNFYEVIYNQILNNFVIEIFFCKGNSFKIQSIVKLTFPKFW